ncbi:hypothetical protein YTPLAS72_02250 [Nitrospira sp.]|nr:hypothetical protein YTPLAS72_02250 [Nitrospira sp.]
MGKRKDQIKVAEGLARGFSQRKAVKEAGYSASTAEKKAFAIVKRPLVQSALTEAVERIMAARNKQFEEIVRPYVDGLDAAVIVKSRTEGIACIAKDPETQEVIPDHDVRIKSADRIVALMGGVPREIEMPAPPPKGLTVIINKDTESGQVTQQTNNATMDRTKIQPTGTSTGDREPKVKIRRAT